MMCQLCGQNPATNHVRRNINGEVTETHLCMDCAAKMGYNNFFGNVSLDLGDFLGSFLGESQHASLAQPSVKRCQGCSASFSDIARTGKVGCAQCYAAFYDELLPSLQRLHGKARHAGKLPLSAGPRARLREQISALKKELGEAVAGQDFETAAALRDQIRSLEEGGDL